MVRISSTNKSARPFYSIQWNADGQPVTGFLSSEATTPDDWAALTAEWARVAAMR